MFGVDMNKFVNVCIQFLRYRVIYLDKLYVTFDEFILTNVCVHFLIHHKDSRINGIILYIVMSVSTKTVFKFTI